MTICANKRNNPCRVLVYFNMNAKVVCMRISQMQSTALRAADPESTWMKNRTDLHISIVHKNWCFFFEGDSVMNTKPEEKMHFPTFFFFCCNMKARVTGLTETIVLQRIHDCDSNKNEWVAVSSRAPLRQSKLYAFLNLGEKFTTQPHPLS